MCTFVYTKENGEYSCVQIDSQMVPIVYFCVHKGS